MSEWIESVRADEREYMKDITVEDGFSFIESLCDYSPEDRLQCIFEDPSVLWYLWPLLSLRPQPHEATCEPAPVADLLEAVKAARSVYLGLTCNHDPMDVDERIERLGAALALLAGDSDA